MYKWFVIFMLGLVIVMYLQKTIVKATAINKGLEECPIRPNSNITIWVKDCNTYLNNLKKDNND